MHQLRHVYKETILRLSLQPTFRCGLRKAYSEIIKLIAYEH